jgi:hypothetical protein
LYEQQRSLSDEHVRLLARFSHNFRERHNEANATGALVAVDNFFVGKLMGVGRVYMQFVFDCKAATPGSACTSSNCH